LQTVFEEDGGLQVEEENPSRSEDHEEHKTDDKIFDKKRYNPGMR
jgi:hypothetical protein